MKREPRITLLMWNWHGQPDVRISYSYSPAPSASCLVTRETKTGSKVTSYMYDEIYAFRTSVLGWKSMCFRGMKLTVLLLRVCCRVGIPIAALRPLSVSASMPFFSFSFRESFKTTYLSRLEMVIKFEETNDVGLVGHRTKIPAKA